jgi:putative endonuclease
MWNVYVLEGDEGRFHYVGMALDVIRRFGDHAAGKVRSTKAHRPLSIVYSEVVGSLQAARRREKYLKSSAGRRWLRKKFGGSLPD